MPEERLQKIIAKSGICSRRQAEELILLGKVLVNGKRVTEMGVKADPNKDKIKVKGKLINPHKDLMYLIYHKPKKCIVTKSDPEGRITIYDLLPKKYHHLNPVGRLDFNSEGLLLLTNDGDLAQKISHPRHKLNKIYQVKVQGQIKPHQLKKMKDGIIIDGKKTMPCDIEIFRENQNSTWFKIVLQEGRNRQIRKMCEAVGLTVKTLVRTHLGPLNLKGITYGNWLERDQLRDKFSI